MECVKLHKCVHQRHVSQLLPSKRLANVCIIKWSALLLTDMQIGQEVYVVSALDPDSTPELVTFDFSPSGNPDSTFNIDHYSGRITLAKLLDHEVEDSYILHLVANDSVHTVSEDLHVSVLDENDNAPIFRDAAYEVCANCPIIYMCMYTHIYFFLHIDDFYLHSHDHIEYVRSGHFCLLSFLTDSTYSLIIFSRL